MPDLASTNDDGDRDFAVGSAAMRTGKVLALLVVALAGCDRSDLDVYSCQRSRRGSQGRQRRARPVPPQRSHRERRGPLDDAGGTCAGQCVPGTPADWSRPGARVGGRRGGRAALLRRGRRPSRALHWPRRSRSRRSLRHLHVRPTERIVRVTGDADCLRRELCRRRLRRGAHVVRSAGELGRHLHRRERDPRREALRRRPLRAVGHDRAADADAGRMPADRARQRSAAADLENVRARLRRR